MKLLFIPLLLFMSCLILPEELIKEKDAVINSLEKRLTIVYDEVIKKMPLEVKVELKKIKSEDEINLTNLTTQDWLHDFCHIDDDKTIELLETLVDLIEKENNDKIRIHGDDLFDLLKNTLWCRLHNKPMNIKKKLELIWLYWAEHEIPDITIAPENKSKIDWIWIFNLDTRPHGAMHVGIIVDTGKLICFERTKGIYYPEGKLLERLKKEQKEWTKNQ